jgi:hypothetical protein
MPLIHWNGRIVEIMAYMAVFLTERVTAVEQKLLPFTKYLNLVGLVLLIFLVFCVVFLCLFVFVPCLVYPMLRVFLDCPFLSCVPNVTSVSGLSILVLCTQCYQCFWIVHSWLALRFTLTFIYSVFRGSYWLIWEPLSIFFHSIYGF